MFLFLICYKILNLVILETLNSGLPFDALMAISYKSSLLSVFHCEFLGVIMLNRDLNVLIRRVPPVFIVSSWMSLCCILLDLDRKWKIKRKERYTTTH